MTTTVTRRVAEIEGALAKALRRGGFEVVTIDGERYLRPILSADMLEHMGFTYPLLSLDAAARDLERLLS